MDGLDGLFPDIADAVVLDEVVPDDGLDLHDEEEVVGRPCHMISINFGHQIASSRHFFTSMSVFFEFVFTPFLCTISGTGRAT